MNVNPVQAPVLGKLEASKKTGATDFQAYLDNAGSGKVAKPNPEAELEAYVKMTPAERIHEALMKKLGLSDDDLAKMTPEQRKSFEEKIGKLVQEELEKSTQKTGTRIDTSA